MLSSWSPGRRTRSGSPRGCKPRVEVLEGRCLPASVIATGTDVGGPPEVRIFDAATGALIGDFMAYDPAFRGGVRVAVADMFGGGTPDIITAPGPSGGPDVRVFDTSGKLLNEFMAYSIFFRGGVYVAAGDVNGDGTPEIITAPDAGGGPDVRVFSKVGAVAQEFYAYDPRFLGGVRVAADDLSHNGRADIITAPGPSGGPDVRIFQGLTGTQTGEFMAYDPSFTGGVYVAAGDVTGGAFADIVTGPGAGSGPTVRVFDGGSQALLREFQAYSPSFTGGVRVGVIPDVNAHGDEEIVTGPGPHGGPDVRVFDGATSAQLDGFYAYASNFTAGLFVGSTRTDFPGGSDLLVTDTVNIGDYTDPQLLGVQTWLLPGAPDINYKPHLTTPIDYSAYTDPPTYGPHFPEPDLPTGVYTTVQPDEMLVHNLEHGHIWISYNPSLVTADEVNQLAFLVREFGPHEGIIMAPRPADHTAIAVASWGHLETFSSLDLAAVTLYIVTNRGHGPEGFITT